MLRTSLIWAWRTALRDARGSRGKALFYALSMALGIGALVAMASFSADMDAAVSGQTRELMGADLSFFSRRPFSEEVTASLAAIPGEQAEMMSFASMAWFPAKGEAQLARVRAVQGGFPFYGSLRTEPQTAAGSYKEGLNAVVERSLASRMDARVGDTLRLGDGTFTISAILEEEPGSSAFTALMGPRIYISLAAVAQTGLVRPGSRVFYSRYFRLSGDMTAEQVTEPREKMLKRERVTWQTVAKQREQLGEAMGNLGRYLGLVACLALLLGGLGVAGAVHYHLKQKVRQVAVLRCLGATVGQVALVFTIQVMAMALLACATGVLLGAGFQRLLPLFLADFIPFELTTRIRPLAILIAVTWGLSMSLLLALAPLVAIRRVSPLLSFRPEAAATGRDKAVIAAYAGVALTWWAFAWAQTGSALRAAIFIGALLICILALFLTARLLGQLARRLLSPRLPFSWRHGLANLFRPHNQTSVFLIILGMGVFLITILTGSRAMLLGQFEDRSYQERSNFIAFDIQADQVDGVRQTIASLDLPVGEAIPIVPMRIAALKGKPIAELTKEIPDWALQREYRSTFRAELNPIERVTAGAWVGEWHGEESAAAPVPVSIEADIAETLKLRLNDEMDVDILGVLMTLRIASIRKVNWQSMQPNFYLVFPTGVLEQAPGMFLMTTRTDGPQMVARLQKELVIRYPNVACVDMSGFVRSLTGVLDRAATVVRFLAGLCILTGFVLLSSAVWSGRYERLGEFALLRTLGATSRQLAQVVLTEYFFLGVFAALAGLILAIGANWALARFLFEVAPFPDFRALLLPVLCLPLLTVALGYTSLRGVWRVAPREVLREEN